MKNSCWPFVELLNIHLLVDYQGVNDTGILTAMSSTCGSGDTGGKGGGGGCGGGSGGGGSGGKRHDKIKYRMSRKRKVDRPGKYAQSNERKGKWAYLYR